MSKLVWTAAFATLLLAAPSLSARGPVGEEKLQAMLKGATPGKPVDCVPLSPTMDSTRIEGIGIVYKRGRTLYVNRFQNGCPSLTSFNTLITRTPSTQSCRGDIARVVDLVTGFEGGSCVFDMFTPYEKAKR